MDYDEDNNTSNNRSTNIPADINDVIREVTPVAWLDNPLSRPQHVVTDNYSPTSPVYDPEHSPIQIDSDEKGGLGWHVSCTIRYTHSYTSK